MPRRNLVIILISLLSSFVCYEKATHNQYALMLTTAMKRIEAYYYEPVERRPLFENAMHGMLSQLDEHSSYISPDNFSRFQQDIEQEFVGIGILVTGPPERPDLTVISPVYDTPAYHAGIRAGDVILAIDGKLTSEMQMNESLGMIKGPKGSELKLKIVRSEAERPMEISIIRDRIRTRSVFGDTRAKGGNWNYFLKDHPEIAYVRVTGFGEHTAEELREVLGILDDQQAKSLILDVRGNPGGLLQAAVEMCDMFLETGLVVSTKGRAEYQAREFHATADTIVDPDLPVVVLVDKLSASASEIFAACLQDHGRATVVGERTWGKGTVQNVFPLEAGRSALKLTTATYHRPSGANIHRRQDATEEEHWGVRADEGFEVILDDQTYRAIYEARQQRDVLEAEIPPEALQVEDLQLERAIEAVGESDEEKLEHASEAA